MLHISVVVTVFGGLFIGGFDYVRTGWEATLLAIITFLVAVGSLGLAALLPEPVFLYAAAEGDLE